VVEENASMGRIAFSQEVCMECSGAKIWLQENGIVRIEYPENFHMTLDVMESVYQQHLQITTDQRPILCDAASVALSDYDAQQFVSTDKAAALTRVLAIVVKSAFTRAMAEMFMMFHKPPFPTRIFKCNEDALEWLQTFLTDEDKVSEKRLYNS